MIRNTVNNSNAGLSETPSGKKDVIFDEKLNSNSSLEYGRFPLVSNRFLLRVTLLRERDQVFVLVVVFKLTVQFDHDHVA